MSKKRTKKLQEPEIKTISEKKILPVKQYSRNDLIMIAVFSLVIILAGYFLYEPTLKYDLVYCDDNIFLQDFYPLNKNPENIKEVFKKTMGTSYYRPILNVSIIMDTQWSLKNQFPGQNPDNIDPRSITPDIFHRTNLIFHLLASFLVFIFLLKLGYPIITSFLFGLIVTVHPVLTPAASWISGRNDSMITVFILLSFIAMVFYFERKGIWKAIAYILHILFFGLSLFTKEIAAFFPFIVFAYLYFVYKPTPKGKAAEGRTSYDKLSFGEKFKRILSSQYIALIAGQFFMGLIWYIMRLKAIEGIQNPDTIGLVALPDNALSVPALVGKFFLPIKMIALSSYEWFTITTGFVFIAIIILLFVYIKNLDKDKSWFGLIWFGLLLFPTLLIRIVYVEDFFDYAEHRAYLVMIGLIIFIIEVLKSYNVDFKKPIPIAVMVIIILLFGYKSYGYREEFMNRKTFWSHMVEMYPYKSRGYLDLGKAYLVEDSLDKAEELYHKGIERNPDNRNLYIDLSAVYLKKTDYPKAEQYAKKALSIEPNNVIAFYNLGKAYFAQGKLEESKQAFLNACKIPKFADWFKDLGDVYYRLNDLPMAIQAYQKAISGNPRNYFAYNNMGLAYAILNKYEEARQCWTNAVNINPKMYEAYYNLIRVAILVDKDLAKAQQIVMILKQHGGQVPDDIATVLKSNGISY
ncbi:tetratricopeptide repeat protein [Bacteroidetes/Chlorobi group bacterium ChocPot_Mid]|jgi:Flp pilus assembly protein TadD|nr:MAG: tetratricopeptide repeat protein [Bacteroidetes/Chlorobi group bacterium ChocPot_Mid]